MRLFTCIVCAYAGPLDRETTAAYTLNITATDGADQPLTGITLPTFASIRL